MIQTRTCSEFAAATEELTVAYFTFYVSICVKKNHMRNAIDKILHNFFPNKLFSKKLGKEQPKIFFSKIWLFLSKKNWPKK